MKAGPAGAGLIVIALAPVETVPLAFVALIVKLLLPGPVGVPESAPVKTSRARPAGSAPVATANTGAGYPLAANVYPAYELPTVPVDGGLEAVNTGPAAAGSTATVIDDVPTLPLAFVALTVKLLLPETLGVPDSTPLTASSDNPTGSDPVATAKDGTG